MPVTDDNAVLVVQITDCHLFAEREKKLLGLNTDHCLAQVVDRVKERHPPDLLVLTGDLSHDGSEQAYTRLKNHFEKLATPVFCLPGNHDESRLLRQTMNDNQFHDCHKTVTENNWQLVFLDTTVVGKEGGHLSDETLYQLNETLTNAPAQPTLLFLHHQPVPIGCLWLDAMAVDNGKALLSLLERHHQVRAVIWGHVHQSFEQMHNQTHLLATPSTCIQFLPGSKRFAVDLQAPGYRWLKLFADGRLETGVERLDEIPGEVNTDNRGY